jgi:hypothetical protein
VREFLQTLNVPATVEFEPAGSEWLSAEWRFLDQPIHVERFLAEDEGIRAELNTWAAFLETCDYSPNNVPLMEHMIQTRQLFTVCRPVNVDDPLQVEQVCQDFVEFLARSVDGVYQVDEEGFFDAEGRLILPEPP